MSGKRGNGEGSIYLYRNGHAAYVWVTKPDGKRARKYVYGKTREEVHDKWIKLHAEAKKGPVATSVPTLAAYLARWVKEVVEPDLKPKTAETYAMHVRLYLTPGLGDKRLDKLTVRDVRTWVNRLLDECQCCAQRKDARRDKPRCCAVGRCCRQVASRRTVQDARAVLRSALTNAMTEELITKNVAGLVKVRSGRKVQRKPWSVEEARRFLEAAQTAHDPLYAAYVLILVLGFRRGEVLGLTWGNVDLEGGGRRNHRSTPAPAYPAPVGP
ncbi:site-specific integrase [Streptomyces sp. NRRL F-5630]|uniref:site-specific integrase n=1 Tax=Streptomyces sp. NRRL F-5630 TaxID=1463864 RepID=UPI003D75637C